MNSIKFRALLKRHIVPMFPGANLLADQGDPKFKGMVFHNVLDPKQVTVQWGPSDTIDRFTLHRYQEFSKEDAHFIRCVLENIREADGIEDSYLFEEIIPPAIRRAVAQQVAPHATDLVASLLRRLEQWAEETYEGRPITAAIGIDPKLPVGGDVKVDEILEMGFGVVMANGLETFLTLAADGSIRGYQPFPDDAVSTKVLSPLRFSRLSGWTIDGRVGLALTRNGEILVFAGKNLSFARRRGIWHYFPHDAVIDRMRSNRSIEVLVAKAAYETCLDVSFARTGGGIGILRPDKVKAVLAGDTISEDDRVSADSPKGRFLEAIIAGRKFQELDRRLRQDLVAIDGSTVLDATGRILAVGAIIKINAGSDGGGRLAAAKTLGHYGVGLKISSDGAIQGFRMLLNLKTQKSKIWKSFQLG